MFRLISHAYLKDKSIIDDNVDMKKLNPTIEDVQLLKIKPLLGTNLYDLIVTQASTATLSANNKILLDEHILRIMTNYIVSESTDILKYRFMNKGVFSKSPENAQNTDLKELQYLSDKYKNIAESYADSMVHYIKSDTSKYPTYLTNSGIDKVKPRGAYDCDIYLPEYYGED